MANVKNLATTSLTGALTASATSVSVEDGSVLPAVPFYATIMPKGELANSKNSEIVSVTAKSDVTGSAGKNLFPESLVTSGAVNGITFTNDANGISLSGTSTAAIDRGGYLDLPKTNISSGTYTLSVNKALPDGVYVQVMYYTASAYAGEVARLTSATGTSVTATNTLPASATRVRFMVSVANGKAVNVTGLKIQLEKGASATSYEPYVEGVISSSLTVTRAQRNTSAKAFAEGDVLTNGIYMEDAVVNDSGVLKTAGGTALALGADNLVDDAINSGKLKWARLHANSNVKVSSNSATSAVTLAQGSYIGTAGLMEIKNNRISFNKDGVALAAGTVYVKGGSAQIHAGIYKYLSNGSSFAICGEKVWSRSNVTDGVNLSLPMVAVQVTAGESLTIIGGSISSYDLVANSNAECNGMSVFFIPSE